MISLRGHRPIFLIEADGQPFNMSRVLRVEVIDAAGYESDELTIVLDDTPPQIERPREGAKLKVSLGFAETGLVSVGTYVFEEIERNGFERKMTLIAKAADHMETLKEPKTRGWEHVAFGDILKKVAREHSLKPVVSKALAVHMIDYAAQTEESDQNFLTRLGRRIGAVVAPKDGHLLAIERHTGKAASGDDLPPIFVTKSKLVSDGAYSVRIKPRSRFSSFRALWEDKTSGTTKEVIVQGGEKGPSYTLRETFQSRGEAHKAATSKRNELRAGEGELSIEMIGEPSAVAEAPISVIDVSPDADGEWIASTVTHVWDFEEGGGATTTIEAQYGMDDKKKKEKKKAPPQGEKEYVSILDR